jgi:hypothetical protein
MTIENKLTDLALGINELTDCVETDKADCQIVTGDSQRLNEV